MIDIKRLAEIAKDKENVVLTYHVRERFESRNIKDEDVHLGLRFGEIIRQFSRGLPYPSRLILYVRINGKSMHFVCSTDNTKIYIITVYDPDPELWEDDYKTRKQGIEMNCCFCGGKMVESTSTYFGDLGDTFVIVKNVPCIKCKQCGEVMYNGVVSERLGQIIDRLRESIQEVTVVTYTAA